jgi:O-acetyl-ADP-ribose deacetylase (regulator of RNase III)
VNATLSPRLNDVLERCLAKSPGERFPSFQAVLISLGPEAQLPAWGIADDPELQSYLTRFADRIPSYLDENDTRLGTIDSYTFPRGQVVRIVRGDITREDARALVSSDDHLLSMGGGVSRAIATAAGPEIAEQAWRLAPVRPGRAVVTTAGRLAAKYIFHGVTVGQIGESWVSPSRDLINEIMTSCFHQADSLYVQSIAFPLLGTGVQRFPLPLCLDTMFRFLARQFLRTLTDVRDARIVIYRA